MPALGKLRTNDEKHRRYDIHLCHSGFMYGSVGNRRERHDLHAQTLGVSWGYPVASSVYKDQERGKVRYGRISKVKVDCHAGKENGMRLS